MCAFLEVTVCASGADAYVLGRTVGVTDGDTITVLDANRTPIRVRLFGIDAPEKAQDFGQKAKQALSVLVFGREVRVEVTSTDRYGRSIGKVHAGTTYVNLAMVQAGFAWHYRQYAPDDQDLLGAEVAARAAGKGLWAQPNPTPPWEWRRADKGSRVDGPPSKAEAALRREADDPPADRTPSGSR